MFRNIANAVRNILKQLVSKDTWSRVWWLNKPKFKKEDREKIFRGNVEKKDILPIIISFVIICILLFLIYFHGCIFH
jgi:uncharacterized membrane protein YvbJ